MKFSRVLLAAFLIFSLFGAAFAAADYYINGQQKTALREFEWGAIVHCPEKIANLTYDEKKYNCELELNSASGKIRIMDESLAGGKKGICNIVFPDKRLQVENDNYGSLMDISCGSMKCSFINERNGDRTLKLPGDTITFHEGVHESTIEGRLGKVTYDQEYNSFIITSPAGKTEIKTEMDGKLTYSGVPLNSHPYRFKYLEFYSDRYNVGLAVDIVKVINPGNYADYKKWDKAYTVKI